MQTTWLNTYSNLYFNVKKIQLKYNFSNSDQSENYFLHS